MEYYFNGCVRSDINIIRDFVDCRMRELHRYILDADKLFDVKLIVNELIINGALHGNKLAQDRSVYLNINIEEGYLTIKVRDEGAGIVYDLENDYYPEQMLSSGRGLVLVNGLADKLVLDHNKAVAIIALETNGEEDNK
ncbi:ATP-binding protein [Neofamilia massiliensis]|uniref:ATP-binding protein n=1 Tax=Neofamilia massiliensis TaxID=1673724 RepID=UPI0006BB9168|nr:ATP-binding protein [Neofamilia massiliensis]